MIDTKRAICIEKDCLSRASFNLSGTKKPIYCSLHKKDNMIDICNPMCIEPSSTTRPIYNYPTEKKPINCATHPGTTTDDTMIDGGACGKKRTDRMIDLGDKILIIECDENQHSDRAPICETTRMFNIGQALGGVSVYFIRWNPDRFRTPKHKQESSKERHEILCEFLTNIKSGQHHLPTSAPGTNANLGWAIYMFYNGWQSAEKSLASCKW
jgi:hypothetical protein